MDFTLDDTQQAIADLAATVLGGDADHARAQQALASTAGYDETLWKAMAQAGLLSLAVPVAQGGDGFGAVEVATVLSAVGRQVLPVPALATLALGVLPIAALGTPAQHEILTSVADGAVLTAALRPMTMTSSHLVSGRVTGVPYAQQAQRILVPTDRGIAIIAPDSAGVSLVPTTSSTGAPEYTLSCASVAVLDVLEGDAAAVDRFAVAGAVAMADGVINGALRLTAEYLRDRVQFGRPLATFQAVAQELGDVYITARTIQLASSAVNWQLAQGISDHDDLEIAAYWLAAELPAALQMCHHLHGGLGVDITYPLHRYYSQAKDLARLVGGSAYRLDRIGA